jgi:hypothetical protein
MLCDLKKVVCTPGFEAFKLIFKVLTFSPSTLPPFIFKSPPTKTFDYFIVSG